MICWPTVFTEGTETYSDKRHALADAFSGWCLCNAGNPPPKKFGEGMVCIGKVLGVPPTDENLDKLYEEWRISNV